MRNDSYKRTIGGDKMKFDKEELKEIVDCIDFVNGHLEMSSKVYKYRDNCKYEFGYLNYLITLRNKIIDELNKRNETRT